MFKLGWLDRFSLGRFRLDGDGLQLGVLHLLYLLESLVLGQDKRHFVVADEGDHDDVLFVFPTLSASNSLGESAELGACPLW